MTTLDRPSAAVLTGILDPRGRRFTRRGTIFESEPRYRTLRAVTAVGHIRALRHHGSRATMSAHWHAVRAHSSWSRA